MKSEEREDKYLVFVDHSFSPAEDRRRVYRGAYQTEAGAVEASKQIVDRALASLRRAHPAECNSPASLLEAFHAFGPDPFIIAPEGTEKVPFCAIEYAAKCCAEIFAGGRTNRRRVRKSRFAGAQRDILDYMRDLCGRGAIMFRVASRRH